MIPLAFTSLFVLLTFILSTTIIVSFLFYGVKMLIGLCLGVITLNELLHFCSICTTTYIIFFDRRFNR